MSRQEQQSETSKKEINFVKIYSNELEVVASWFKNKQSGVMPAYRGKWESVWKYHGLHLKLLNVTRSDLGLYRCDFRNGRRSLKHVVFTLGDDCVIHEEFRNKAVNDLKLQKEQERKIHELRSRVDGLFQNKTVNDLKLQKEQERTMHELQNQLGELKDKFRILCIAAGVSIAALILTSILAFVFIYLSRKRMHFFKDNLRQCDSENRQKNGKSAGLLIEDARA